MPRGFPVLRVAFASLLLPLLVAAGANAGDLPPLPPRVDPDAPLSERLAAVWVFSEDGGRSLRFCPRFPEVIPGFAYPDQALRETQNRFYALDLTRRLDPDRPDFESNPVSYELEVAVGDGTFKPVGSFYDAQNNRIVEGHGRLEDSLQGAWAISEGRCYDLSCVRVYLLHCQPVTATRRAS